VAVAGIPPIIGLVYVIAGIPLVAYLLHKGKFFKKIGIAFTLISVALGFLIFAPMAPFQLQSLVLNDPAALGAPAGAIIAILIIFILVVLVTGRIFCGYLCPIGAVQELAYHVPAKKLRPVQKNALIIIRLAVLLIFFAAAFFLSTGILSYFGIFQFFNLEITSVLFVVFLVILFVSLSFYRPFCRIICPLGALYSLAAMKGLFKFRRSEACTDCRKCEAECPTNEAKREDAKGECYLCGRCVEVCPAGAISYRRK
jgi:polyferredoxin